MNIKIIHLAAVAALVSACSFPPTEDLSNEVRIIRDEFGTPHIYAEQIHGLFFGYGYAVAQDRLFQMEMARRSTQGLVAEVLGKDYADYDESVRRGFAPASIHKQLAALAQDDQDIFSGYAAGINAWLVKIEASPETLLPKEFTDFGFDPVSWTAYDVAMIFVGTMANRYGDFNTELENGQMLSALARVHGQQTAKIIFDDLNPQRNEAAPTTIDAADWPAENNGHAFMDSNLIDSRIAAPITASLLANNDLATSLPVTGFSNCFIFGPKKSIGANAILVNGPQFGWYVPAYVYSVGLHGAGFDMVGNTPFAYPVLLFGHNDTIAWGSTWGAGDIVDIYHESLNPLDADEYLYKGEYRKFEERTEVIRIKNAETRQVVVQRSVHGPVVAVDVNKNSAYSKQRSWDGKELKSLLAWLHSGRTTQFDDWLTHAEKAALNINWYYADKSGNIGYAFVGEYPQRVTGHDNRLVARGDGSMDWLDRKPFSSQPHILNPSSGFIANWNNKPAPGVLNPDEFWFSWSSADRVDYLLQTFQSQSAFTPDQAWEVIKKSSYTDVNAPYFLDFIKTAAAQSDSQQLKQASELLLSWDLQTRDENQDGFYDAPQSLLFQAFLTQLIHDVLADDLGDTFKLFSSPGYPTPGQQSDAGVNIATGTKTLVEALRKTTGYDFLNGRTPEDVVGATLSSVLQRLHEEHGDPMENWRLAVAPRPYSTNNFLGIPQTSEANSMEAPIEQNRGTENDMIILNADGIVAYEVTPPGQSGFINPKGEKTQHYDDQFELYYSFGKKRMWFYPEDVLANKQSETVLQIPPVSD